jgi:hypothetical protein
LSTTERNVKYPPTAVSVRTSYNEIHASLTEKAKSKLSKAMNNIRVQTNSNTMRGRTLDASHEPLALSEVHLCDLVLQLETLCDEVE